MVLSFLKPKHGHDRQKHMIGLKPGRATTYTTRGGTPTLTHLPSPFPPIESTIGESLLCFLYVAEHIHYVFYGSSLAPTPSCVPYIHRRCSIHIQSKGVLDGQADLLGMAVTCVCYCQYSCRWSIIGVGYRDGMRRLFHCGDPGLCF